jgi:hypothetical protein
MTIRRLFAFVVIAFSMAGISFADDDFSTPLTLHIPKSTSAYAADPLHEVGDSAIYQTHGKIYSETINSQKVSKIAVTAEPMLTFTKLIAAYATQDIDNFKKIYDPESAADLNKISADPQILTNWKSEASRIGDGHLIAVIQVDPDNYYFYVRYPTAQGGPGLPIPIYIHRHAGTYFPASGDISNKMISNTLMFLCDKHSEDIVK